jgi:predicted HTH transcriptional regulator
MQIDKEAGLVKLTNQRLIFAGSLNTTEWSFAKMLSAARNEEGNDFIIGVSNRKKTSGLKFSAADGKAFARLFALALYAYENGIPETIKEIKSEITMRNQEKPKLVLTAGSKKSKGELEHNI